MKETVKEKVLQVFDTEDKRYQSVRYSLLNFANKSLIMNLLGNLAHLDLLGEPKLQDFKDHLMKQLEESESDKIDLNFARELIGAGFDPPHNEAVRKALRTSAEKQRSLLSKRFDTFAPVVQTAFEGQEVKTREFKDDNSIAYLDFYIPEQNVGILLSEFSNTYWDGQTPNRLHRRLERVLS